MQWEIICVDKREVFLLGGLLKLLEIAWNPVDGRAMAVLLALRGGSHRAFGRWAGSRVVLLGTFSSVFNSLASEAARMVSAAECVTEVQCCHLPP